MCVITSELIPLYRAFSPSPSGRFHTIPDSEFYTTEYNNWLLHYPVMSQYRVVHLVKDNLLLTLKNKLGFSIRAL